MPPKSGFKRRLIFDRLLLPFQHDRKLRRQIYDILGFYPHNIEYYRTAFAHSSSDARNRKGKPLNNERLEFLGDAVLEAVVSDIVFRHFNRRREGFLTGTRSKIVQRSTLNQLADKMGISRLVKRSASLPESSHAPAAASSSPASQKRRIRRLPRLEISRSARSICIPSLSWSESVRSPNRGACRAAG